MKMAMNSRLELRSHGQSVWLDYIRRDLLIGGGLRALVREDGLRGVTSNPTIFEKAITSSTDYDAGIAGLLARNSQASATDFAGNNDGTRVGGDFCCARSVRY